MQLLPVVKSPPFAPRLVGLDGASSDPQPLAILFVSWGLVTSPRLGGIKSPQVPLFSCHPSPSIGSRFVTINCSNSFSILSL
jgi:hypothetical protein